MYQECTLNYEGGYDMKKRITVLLGAGAVVEATNVSTASITKRVIEECRGYKISSKSNQSVVDYIQ